MAMKFLLHRFWFNKMESMKKHEEKICPRCGKAFECKVGDIINCQCYGIQLDQTVMDFINKNYEDCLCRACMDSLNKENQLEVKSVIGKP
jgi:hypothetical protein